MLLDAGHTVTFVDANDPKPQGAERYSFIPYPGMFGLEKVVENVVIKGKAIISVAFNGRYTAASRRVYARIRGDGGGPRTVNRLGKWLKALQLRLIWYRVRPDVVHVHWVDVRAEHCAKAKLHPLIVTCWGSDINNICAPDYRDTDYRNRIGSTLSCADHVTADTVEILTRCEQLSGQKLSSSLFFFGVDFQKFNPGYLRQALSLRSEKGIPANGKVILSVRALRPLMGHHFVLEAFSELSKEAGSRPIYLAFIRYNYFADGYETNLRIKSAEMGLSKRVIWLEAVSNDEMPVYYTMADVVVNYPERDGFPVTLFEATACKRPVISSRLDAYKGALDADIFRLVQPKSPSSLADAMRRCIEENSDVAQKRMEKAFLAIQDIGDERRCIKTIERDYQSVLSRRRGKTVS